jgi:hypothetical protein
VLPFTIPKLVDANGWFALIWPDSDGLLQLEKDGDYGVHGKRYHETFEVVSVEDIENKDKC